MLRRSFNASGMPTRAAPSAATAAALGDYFQYIIDQPVTLGRQKSALLPIINKDVDATRVRTVPVTAGFGRCWIPTNGGVAVIP